MSTTASKVKTTSILTPQNEILKAFELMSTAKAMAEIYEEKRKSNF